MCFPIENYWFSSLRTLSDDKDDQGLPNVKERRKQGFLMPCIPPLIDKILFHVKRLLFTLNEDVCTNYFYNRWFIVSFLF